MVDGGTAGEGDPSRTGFHEARRRPGRVFGFRHRFVEGNIVDDRAQWLRANGALLESEPQEYTYMPGYYAVFFYDPDGLKLEILHVPALAA